MVTPVRLNLGRVYNSGRLSSFGERPKLLSDDPIYFSGAQHQYTPPQRLHLTVEPATAPTLAFGNNLRIHRINDGSDIRQEGYHICILNLATIGAMILELGPRHGSLYSTDSVDEGL